jgi:Domain of unknown function (DUF4352)
MHLLLQKRNKRILKICGALAMVALLAACGDSSNTSAVTPTIQSGTVAVNTPGAGPTVIAGGTTVVAGNTNTATSTTPGNPQKRVITLVDRALTIGPVGKQAGTDASTTGVSLTLIVTNTGKSPIMNQATFYQLIGAGGDSFGTQSSVSANFYGSIPPHGSRQGTIVFQVPTGAVKGINLLFRPEVATETTIIQLNI